MKDYVGRLVKMFESGNKGSLSIGQSGIDCGCSYGTYQFILRYGVVIDFLKRFFPNESKSLYYNGPDAASSSWPGKDYSSSPDEVTKVWMTCYNKVGADKFFEYEHQQIEDICYKPCKDRIIIQTGFDVDKISRAYQELVWSGSVHFGATVFADMLVKAIRQVGNFASNQDKVFDLIYKMRYEKMKEAYSNPGNRYLPGFSDGSSEVETLRPYLTIKPLRGGNTTMKKLGLVIDPGHSPGYNPGIDPNIREGDVMFSLSEAEKNYCDATYSKNVDCILTRTRTEDPSLEAGRGHKAIELKQSGKYEKVMFMSDHTNAPGGDPPNPNVTGICIFTSQFRKNTDTFLRKLGDEVARIMNSHFLYMDAQPLKPSDPSDWWGVVRGAMDHARNQAEANQRGADYAFILEHGFHTNPVECAYFGSKANIEAMAKGKIDFIMKSLGIPKNTPNSTMTDFWYCDGTVHINNDVTLYSGPRLNSTVKGSAAAGTKHRAVQGIRMSDKTDWYRLETGFYVQNTPNIAYSDNKMKPFVVSINSPDHSLNLRDFPNSMIGNVKRTFSNGNLVNVIGEAYNSGDHWYLINQGDANEKFSGFIAARYVK